MIQISFDKVIPSRNDLENCTRAKKVRIKEWWQENTEERLKYHNEKFAYLLVMFELYFKTKRNRDIDNYMASLGIKGIIDGIVSCGLIPDDNEKYLNYSIGFNIDRDNPRTEVVIYGAKEGDNSSYRSEDD